MSDALAAALLASQRGQQQFDPAENSRRFARMLLQQGSSTAPVQSWGEGLARALTGVAGGVFEGMGRRDQEEKNKRLIEGLTAAYGAPDEASRMEALKGLGGDGSGVLAPFLASMLSAKVADERKNKILDTKLDAGGIGTPSAQPGMGGGQQGPLTIDMTPLPSGTAAPSAFNNNLGNIRSGVGFQGEGPPQNGFATFGTPQQGANAMAQNLRAYINQNPTMTVAQAIAKWAPPNENNTQQYISQVAEGTGINPGMPLAEVLQDPAAAATLLDAIARKEKGGLPPGVNADTFMAATGGAPGQPQVAQGSSFQPTGTPAQSIPGGLPQMPPQEGPATTLPEVSPAAQALVQEAQRARAGGDRERALALMQKAQEAQATYVQERAKTQDTRAYEQGKTAEKRQADAEEHDRRERTKTMTKEQSDAATFADRMIMAEKTLGELGNQQGTSAKGKMLDTTVFGVGIPGANYAQSKEYQQYKQARENFAYALLRRETGAAIQPFEYETIDKTYMPQPGDGAEVLAQKAQARRVALEGMRRAAGPTYATNPTATQPPAGAPSGGAPQPGTVMDGYRFKGGDPSKQENWERAQ